MEIRAKVHALHLNSSGLNPKANIAQKVNILQVLCKRVAVGISLYIYFHALINTIIQ